MIMTKLRNDGKKEALQTDPPDKKDGTSVSTTERPIDQATTKQATTKQATTEQPTTVGTTTIITTSTTPDQTTASKNLLEVKKVRPGGNGGETISHEATTKDILGRKDEEPVRYKSKNYIEREHEGTTVVRSTSDPVVKKVSDILSSVVTDLTTPDISNSVSTIEENRIADVKDSFAKKEQQNVNLVFDNSPKSVPERFSPPQTAVMSEPEQGSHPPFSLTKSLAENIAPNIIQEYSNRFSGDISLVRDICGKTCGETASRMAFGDPTELGEVCGKSCAKSLVSLTPIEFQKVVNHFYSHDSAHDRNDDEKRHAFAEKTMALIMKNHNEKTPSESITQDKNIHDAEIESGSKNPIHGSTKDIEETTEPQKTEIMNDKKGSVTDDRDKHAKQEDNLAHSQEMQGGGKKMNSGKNPSHELMGNDKHNFEMGNGNNHGHELNSSDVLGHEMKGGGEKEGEDKHHQKVHVDDEHEKRGGDEHTNEMKGALQIGSSHEMMGVEHSHVTMDVDEHENGIRNSKHGYEMMRGDGHSHKKKGEYDGDDTRIGNDHMMAEDKHGMRDGVEHGHEMRGGDEYGLAVWDGDGHGHEMRSGDEHSPEMRSGEHSHEMMGGDEHKYEMTRGDEHGHEVRGGDEQEHEIKGRNEHGHEMRGGDEHENEMRGGDGHTPEMRSGEHSHEMMGGVEHGHEIRGRDEYGHEMRGGDEHGHEMMGKDEHDHEMRGGDGDGHEMRGGYDHGHEMRSGNEHEHEMRGGIEHGHKMRGVDEDRYGIKGGDELEHEMRGGDDHGHEMMGKGEHEHEMRDLDEGRHKMMGKDEHEHEMRGGNEHGHEIKGGDEHEHEMKSGDEHGHEMRGVGEGRHEINGGDEHRPDMMGGDQPGHEMMGGDEHGIRVGDEHGHEIRGSDQHGHGIMGKNEHENLIGGEHGHDMIGGEEHDQGMANIENHDTSNGDNGMYDNKSHDMSEGDDHKKTGEGDVYHESHNEKEFRHQMENEGDDAHGMLNVEHHNHEMEDKSENKDHGIYSNHLEENQYNKNEHNKYGDSKHTECAHDRDTCYPMSNDGQHNHQDQHGMSYNDGHDSVTLQTHIQGTENGQILPLGFYPTSGYNNDENNRGSCCHISTPILSQMGDDNQSPDLQTGSHLLRTDCCHINLPLRQEGKHDNSGAQHIYDRPSYHSHKHEATSYHVTKPEYPKETFYPDIHSSEYSHKSQPSSLYKPIQDEYKETHDHESIYGSMCSPSEHTYNHREDPSNAHCDSYHEEKQSTDQIGHGDENPCCHESPKTEGVGHTTTITVHTKADDHHPYEESYQSHEMKKEAPHEEFRGGQHKMYDHHANQETMHTPDNQSHEAFHHHAEKLNNDAEHLIDGESHFHHPAVPIGKIGPGSQQGYPYNTQEQAGSGSHRIPTTVQQYYHQPLALDESHFGLDKHTTAANTAVHAAPPENTYENQHYILPVYEHENSAFTHQDESIRAHDNSDTPYSTMHGTEHFSKPDESDSTQETTISLPTHLNINAHPLQNDVNKFEFLVNSKQIPVTIGVPWIPQVNPAVHGVMYAGGGPINEPLNSYEGLRGDYNNLERFHQDERNLGAFSAVQRNNVELTMMRRNHGKRNTYNGNINAFTKSVINTKQLKQKNKLQIHNHHSTHQHKKALEKDLNTYKHKKLKWLQTKLKHYKNYLKSVNEKPSTDVSFNESPISTSSQNVVTVNPTQDVQMLSTATLTDTDGRYDPNQFSVLNRNIPGDVTIAGNLPAESQFQFQNQ